MKENRIEIVLRNGRSIGQQFRNPGFVLLEGIAPENVTSFDIEKAITNKDVQARPAKAAAPAPEPESVPDPEPEQPAQAPEPKPAVKPKPKKKAPAKNKKKKK